MPDSHRYVSGDGSLRKRTASPIIWKDCPWQQIKDGSVAGVAIFDDFHSAGAALSSNRAAFTGSPDGTRWNAFGTLGVGFTGSDGSAGARLGELSIDTDADDEEAYLAPDDTYGSLIGEISDTAGSNFKLWFEAGVKFGNVASGAAAHGKFVGLGSPDAAATGTLAADAAALSGIANFVGFRALAADGDGMDAVHQDDVGGSGAEVVVEEAADDSNLVITADTYYHYGIYFDGKKVYWYVNGVLIAASGILPSATNFPDADPLVPCLGVRVHGAVDALTTVDYVRFAQLNELL